MKPNYDARTAGATRTTLAQRAAGLAAKPAPGVRALRGQLGIQGIVELDPLTGTPRRVARTDGFLTGPSRKAAEWIVRDFVNAHPDVFALTPAEVASLRLRKNYVDIAGTRHLSFIQTVGGVPVFGNGLRAHVTKDGRLIQVDGSPLANLPATSGGSRLTAAQARSAAVADVFGSSKATVTSQTTTPEHTTTFAGGDRAQLVVFDLLGGPRLAWQTITMKEGYLHVIDAQTGRTLFRQNLVLSDDALVWKNYPGAPRGGTAKVVSLTRPGWLPNGSPELAGNIAHVFKDVNDDNTAQASEEVRPSGRNSFRYPLTHFTPTACPSRFVCTWNPERANSWQQNSAQNAVQLFYFLGTFHDHLKKAPIGFTRAAGNFEAVDGDAVQGNAIDGANLVAGLPDGNHVDNANMTTPPDGLAPTMQMYLFHQPGSAFPDEDPYLAGNSGDEADIVYHEYTHGLSNRLVVDANGVSTLGGIQAGAMGEAWSDWYAMDLLVNQGMFTDTGAAGDLRVGDYVGWGNDLIRTQPLDCPVGTTSSRCPGTPGAGPGGYTYGDYARIIGDPEVHADGEIWGETLWDLRKALGSRLAESLVTRAMELSPGNPSFLDMRNSILQADLVVDGGRRQAQIWKVFAARGMGYFAGSLDGDDTAPVESFSTPPPASTPRGTLTGTVTDADSGSPISGAAVAFGGLSSGFTGSSYAALTDATGKYAITGIFPGTYPKVSSRGAGFDTKSQTVSIASQAQVLDWALRRDWAASSGGGAIGAFTPPDYTPFGCGPGSLIDQSQGSGWGSDAPDNPSPSTQPKSAVVVLPAAVNIREIVVNPSNTCGDAGSASTGDYRVETSTDGITWAVANQGHFGLADRQPTSIPLAAGSTAAVKFVRYTMVSTQVADLGGSCPGLFSGCDFMDSTELSVYGTQP
ncbi:M36 family metallopeptidase [Terrabacter sp. Ter38]|uniref:M36 family metallopeptidase n=1 Tax=Terrabacter sp. Ter38 TaxID=2926030 RepID=UPI0021185A24|nr:M36 family metallopeptidase [Terrabacter sp. Ter38]